MASFSPEGPPKGVLIGSGNLDAFDPTELGAAPIAPPTGGTFRRRAGSRAIPPSIAAEPPVNADPTASSGQEKWKWAKELREIQDGLAFVKTAVRAAYHRDPTEAQAQEILARINSHKIFGMSVTDLAKTTLLVGGTKTVVGTALAAGGVAGVAAVVGVAAAGGAMREAYKEYKEQKRQGSTLRRYGRAMAWGAAKSGGVSVFMGVTAGALNLVAGAGAGAAVTGYSEINRQAREAGRLQEGFGERFASANKRRLATHALAGALLGAGIAYGVVDTEAGHNIWEAAKDTLASTTEVSKDILVAAKDTLESTAGTVKVGISNLKMPEIPPSSMVELPGYITGPSGEIIPSGIPVETPPVGGAIDATLESSTPTVPQLNLDYPLNVDVPIPVGSVSTDINEVWMKLGQDRISGLAGQHLEDIDHLTEGLVTKINVPGKEALTGQIQTAVQHKIEGFTNTAVQEAIKENPAADPEAIMRVAAAKLNTTISDITANPDHLLTRAELTAITEPLNKVTSMVDVAIQALVLQDHATSVIINPGDSVSGILHDVGNYSIDWGQGANADLFISHLVVNPDLFPQISNIFKEEGIDISLTPEGFKQLYSLYASGDENARRALFKLFRQMPAGKSFNLLDRNGVQLILNGFGIK